MKRLLLFRHVCYVNLKVNGMCLRSDLVCNKQKYRHDGEDEGKDTCRVSKRFLI
jgi:hypothetical protein